MNLNSLVSVDTQTLIFEASSLRPEPVIEALKTYGCALVKGVFPSEIMVQFGERAKVVLEALNRMFEAKQLPYYYHSFYQKNHVPFFSVHELDSPNELAYQLIHYFAATIMAEVINGYFDSEVSWVDPRSTVVRRVLPGLENRVPFHQEGPYIQTNIPMLTCWVPFVACGQDAPSLEMITTTIGSMLPALDNPYREIPEPWVMQHYGHLCWHPPFVPGDLMIFEHFTVHRTHMTASMTQPRYSLEIRSIPAGICPPNLNESDMLVIPRLFLE